MAATPDPDHTAAFDAATADFGRLRPLLWQPVSDGTVELSHPRPGERVLDACCGDGASAIPTARAVGPEGRVDAVDLSPGLLAELRGRAGDLPQLHVEQADATRWGQPASYDLVQCVLGVFFPDMEQGTRHLISLIRPGGRAALTVWRRGALDPVGAALHEMLPGGLPWADSAEPPLITQVNTPSAWGSWLTGLGLADVQVHEVEAKLELDDETAWCLVVGTRYRGLVAELSEAEQADFRRRFLRALRRDGVDRVDVTTLVGVGSVS